MTTAASTPALYVALELGQDRWHLACATQAAEKPRLRAIPARDLGRLADEIRKANILGSAARTVEERGHKAGE